MIEPGHSDLSVVSQWFVLSISRTSFASLPVFIDGKWRTPPEDVGGAPSFEMFLHAMADPAHDEHENLL